MRASNILNRIRSPLARLSAWVSSRRQLSKNRKMIRAVRAGLPVNGGRLAGTAWPQDSHISVDVSRLRFELMYSRLDYYGPGNRDDRG